MLLNINNLCLTPLTFDWYKELILACVPSFYGLLAHFSASKKAMCPTCGLRQIVIGVPSVYKSYRRQCLLLPCRVW